MSQGNSACMGKCDPYTYKRNRGQHTAVHPKTYPRGRNGRLSNGR